MTYRSLLVLLDQEPLCAARTELAVRLARQHDCHLVGVAPTGLIDLPLSAEVVAAQAEFSALAWDALRDQAERATDRFRDACVAGGVKSFEAVIDEAEKAESLVHHAHCSDLTILSQTDPDHPGRRLDHGMVEQVVLQSARPTLVVPYAGRFETVGSSVMVAWDDSREAARALADALPFLRTASAVQVVSWNESDAQDDDKALRTRIAAVGQWLLWQGVSAEVRVEKSEVGIADAMLSRAADLGADLIVMGAYGHSRWTERVLGGATRGLLRSMTVPVLMSH
jgi:nucleotide-binding universal stress UspA family protein